MKKTAFVMAATLVTATLGLAACKPEMGKKPGQVMDKVGEQLGEVPTHNKPPRPGQPPKR
ncbi:MAG: hypothetical protein Alpg2KO_22630 [Alphaproteobacteria bacterium]